MKQKQKQKLQNDDFIYVILTVFFVLGSATFIHDPILHSVAATIVGFSVEGYTTGLMVGSTDVIAPINAAWWKYELFFMFPAIIIFVLIAIITIARPEKLIMVGGIIVGALNLPSLNPAITGSDAFNAANMMAKQGVMSEGFAMILHYLLFFVVLLVWGLFLYVAIESNSKDSRARIENIYH